MKCFKKAIEIEAGNADFWNALGVVTTKLNPQVAQHCFIRSLHLNERSVQTWTNLGTLYLLHNDVELAHKAFSRAQSTDPDYAHAWVGEGIVALLWGDARGALSHFVHAFDISNSSSIITKRQLAVSTFDHLVSSPSRAASNITALVQPLFALQQLSSQTPTNAAFRHLEALFLERVGNYNDATKTLETLCTDLEAAYESSEAPETLSRFAAAKADLARQLLALDKFPEAAETAETALDLLSEESGLTFGTTIINKIRLSARMTLGLAQHYQSTPATKKESISTFRLALTDSSSSPDVVCLLATVLWADGGEDEESVAKEQLFDVIDRNPSHLDAVVLLGAMAVVEQDAEAMDAVKGDLITLRYGGTGDNPKSKPLSLMQAARVERVLDAIAAVSQSLGGVNITAPDKDAIDPVLATVQTSIMFTPSQPNGWSSLAEFSDETFPAEMALTTAKRSIPPYAELEPDQLAKAFYGTGLVADWQRGHMVAPWGGVGTAKSK
jgi:superkiller protein 3